jgi:glucan phosphoethanolaminetransferase (alkaline phosphatase superfamily)
MAKSPLLGILYFLIPLSWVLYLLIVTTKIPKDIRISSTMKKAYLGVTLVFISSFFVHNVSAVGKFPNTIETTSFTNRFYDTYPYGSFSKLLQAHHYVRLEQSRTENIKGFTFNATAKKELNEKEVYVLIIGESSRYSNWGINGYTRNTSPQLNRIDGLISYSNVSACASQTILAIPIMCTRATPDNYSIWYREKSFLAAFKECNYKTYWISNQAKDTSAFENEADETIYLNPNKHSNAHYDGDMLPILQKILERDESKVFIVIHTMGNHQNYWNRYPDKFDVFKPSPKQQIKQKHGVVLNSIKDRNTIVNSYDNSILYTDFFISSIIRMVEKTDSLSSVVFVPDHAENLCDDERQLYYRGRPIPTKYEAHIPMFIWLSDSYKSTYPAKAQSFIAHKDRATSEENIFYSMMDMCNIGYDGEDLTKSIASNTFSEKERNFLTVSYTVIPYKNLF